MSGRTTSSAAAPQPGTVFKVADMSCAHCVATIRDALEAGMPAGTAIAVDLENQRVTVAGDAARAAAAIREAGYEPVPLGA